MDDRAYHLQARAHRVVHNAIRNGELIREPCEECGDVGQAHHDSYYPDKWLKVRWLCGKHHRQWHRNNEPEWPTIFEYHPCDSEWTLPNSTTRRGRPPKPWYWRQRNQWAVNIDGKRYSLGTDKDEAERKCRELVSSLFLSPKGV